MKGKIQQRTRILGKKMSVRREDKERVYVWGLDVSRDEVLCSAGEASDKAKQEMM